MRENRATQTRFAFPCHRLGQDIYRGPDSQGRSPTRASFAGRFSSVTATSFAPRLWEPCRTPLEPTRRRFTKTPTARNHARNARIHIATYQTLDVDTEEGTANFLTTYYPPDYFSQIVIDECHRSAWGKWSQVLTRNPNAVQIGLTATPRHLEDERKDEGGPSGRGNYRRQHPTLRRAGLRIRHEPGH